MKREVILIKGTTNNNDEKMLSNSYVYSYKLFFESDAGGAFEAEEIITLYEPTIDVLKELVIKSGPDYAILILIGHGANQDDKQLFKINHKEIINAGQLELAVPKQIVIVESCRSIRSNIPVVKITDKIPNYKAGGILRLPISRAKAKKIYNKAIMSSRNGIIICYACGQGETASNFYFSKNLIEQAKTWNNSTANVSTILPITTLMESVASTVGKIIKKNNQTQTPETLGNIDFPFVVSKY